MDRYDPGKNLWTENPDGEKVKAMVAEIFEAALEVGGTLSGEHGVGTLKLPYLEKEVWQRFDRDSFTLIVIGREEDDEIIAPFVEKHGYTIPFAGDPDMVAYSQYASRFIPRNFIIGPDGTILYQSQGYERRDFERMIEIIEQAVDAIRVTHDPQSPDIPDVPVETEAG